MTALSMFGFRLPDRIAASRSSSIASVRASNPGAPRSVTANPGTRVTLGPRASSGAVYRDPRTMPGVVRLWSSPVGQDDTVSTLMARNRGLHSYNLGDQWRGLGGASLARFGQTGEDYSQALVDAPSLGSDAEPDALSPAEQAQRAADLLAAQSAQLAGVASNAPSVALTIKTRSGM